MNAEQELKQAREEIKVLQDNLRDCIERLAKEMRQRLAVVAYCRKMNHSGVNAAGQVAVLRVLELLGEKS